MGKHFGKVEPSGRALDAGVSVVRWVWGCEKGPGQQPT